MNLERIVKVITNAFLFFLEYFFKFSSGVTGLIVLGAGGSFFVKLATGFGSVLPALARLFEFPQTFINTTTIINDYNTLTAAAFNQRYGTQAVNHVMESMNVGVAYFHSVYQNLAWQPVETVFAVALAFSSLYLIGRGICFIRQKGQGSCITRLERKLGCRIFKISVNGIPHRAINNRHNMQNEAKYN